MGLKRQTKRHQNNTPICFAHLDKCNGIVLACWRSTLPTYGAGKSPVFFSPSCEPASCRLLLPFLQLRRVPPPRQLTLLKDCRAPQIRPKKVVEVVKDDFHRFRVKSSHFPPKIAL